MNFSENINRICAENGTTLSAVVRKLGWSTSKVTLWNSGSIPKADAMVKLAKELNCSVMDFFADEIDLAEQGKIYAVTPDEEDLLRAYRAASRRGKHELMVYAYGLEKNSEGDTK